MSYLLQAGRGGGTPDSASDGGEGGLGVISDGSEGTDDSASGGEGGTRGISKNHAASRTAEIITMISNRSLLVGFI